MSIGISVTGFSITSFCEGERGQIRQIDDINLRWGKPHPARPGVANLFALDPAFANEFATASKIERQ